MNVGRVLRCECIVRLSDSRGHVVAVSVEMMALKLITVAQYQASYALSRFPQYA